jgi:hypothetical protein
VLALRDVGGCPIRLGGRTLEVYGSVRNAAVTLLCRR